MMENLHSFTHCACRCDAIQPVYLWWERECGSTGRFSHVTGVKSLKCKDMIQREARNIERNKEDNTLDILQNIIICSETDRGMTDTVSGR